MNQMIKIVKLTHNTQHKLSRKLYEIKRNNKNKMTKQKKQ